MSILRRRLTLLTWYVCPSAHLLLRRGLYVRGYGVMDMSRSFQDQVFVEWRPTCSWSCDRDQKQLVKPTCKPRRPRDYLFTGTHRPPAGRAVLQGSFSDLSQAQAPSGPAAFNGKDALAVCGWTWQRFPKVHIQSYLAKQ